MDGCEHLAWKNHSKSDLRPFKLPYAATLGSLFIHTLFIFSISNLVLPPVPSKLRPFSIYNAYLADLAPENTASRDTPAKTSTKPILPDSLKNENLEAPSPAPPDIRESSIPLSPRNQEQLTTPAVIAPPSAKKLVADHRKVQRIPQIQRELDSAAPDNAPNGRQSPGDEASAAVEPLNKHESLSGATPPPGAKLETTAKDFDIQQFLSLNINDIGGKVMAVLQYPPIAKRMKWQGLSSIEFILHPSGEVTDLRVEKSSGHEILDKHAIAAVKAAAPFNGPQRELSVTLPVRFHLD